MTPPRGIEMSALSSTCLSASSIGRPCSNGRVCPYCTFTYPDLEAFNEKRPPGSSRNSKRPSASVSAVLTPTSGAVNRTWARRIGVPLSEASTRPRIRPVPVFICRGPPSPGGIIIGSPPVDCDSMKICCARAGEALAANTIVNITGAKHRIVMQSASVSASVLHRLAT